MTNKREDKEKKHLNDPKAFIDHSSSIDDVYDIMTNRKFQAINKELFIRCSKLNISLKFITQSYFSVPKKVRLILKIHNKRKLQQVTINHSADIINIL